MEQSVQGADPPSSRTRILFLPEVGRVPTSERTPTLFRLLDAREDVRGLSAPWDRYVYDTTRAKWPRYLLYLPDKLLLALRGVVAGHRHRSQVVWCETPHHAIVGLIIARILGARCVWDSHGNARLFSQSVGKGWFYTSLATALERFLGNRVDLLVTVSERDAHAYTEMGIRESSLRVVPLFVDASPVDLRAGDEPGKRDPRSTDHVPKLLFFGSFRYAPNVQALDFIDQSLAPYLEENGIPCEIWIAGRDIPDRPFHRFVRPIGFVPHIKETIRDVDLCVVPVWTGVGVLTKVLDILAAGRPAVLSGFAARGIPELEHGVHALVGPTKDSFLGLVATALKDPEACRSLAARAYRLIEEHYSVAANIPRLDMIVRGMSAKGGRS